MRLFTLSKLLNFFFLFFLFAFIFFEEEIVCSKFGNRIFDKILGIDHDCYKRKADGIIFPSERVYGRYNSLTYKTKVDCPKNSPIIIVSGQSNSANFIKSKVRFNNNHLNYFNGNCYNLNSPVLGAEGEMSAIAPSIAKKIKSNEKFIFVTSGIAGISIEDAANLKSNFVLYNKKALEELKINGNYLKYFIWIHGEANNQRSKNYEKFFFKIFNSIVENNPKDVNLIITQSSICKNLRDKNLNDIQKKIFQKYNNFEEVINTDDLGNKFRYDGCHYNAYGQEKISNKISYLINKSESE